MKLQYVDRCHQSSITGLGASASPLSDAFPSTGHLLAVAATGHTTSTSLDTEVA